MAIINIDYRDKREQRKFGLLIGSIFLVLGTIRFALHGFCLSAQILGGIGIVLILLGLIFPPALMPLFFLWLKIAEALNWVITKLLLLMVFYLILTPTGILYRVFKGDPLNRKWEPDRQSYWEEVDVQPKNIDEFRRQF
ncbi:MAG: SxtJ family membrane protein [Candidatus Hydrogenedentes bacterium]|nr:SxtJ family membrane protein [Candidatus Hydrogenedentota bacterium]